MTYPRVNKNLGTSYTNEEVEGIIRYLADPPAKYWGLEDTKLKTLRNQIDQLLHRQAYSNNYYLTASTLGIAQTVGLIHVFLGGLEETNNKLMELTKKALDYLAIGGEANQISKDSWIITQYPLRIYGEGKNWVYLYYFLRDEVEARASSKDLGDFQKRMAMQYWQDKNKRPGERQNSKRNRVHSREGYN